MDDVLGVERLRKLGATQDDVCAEVASNAKQRFALRTDEEGRLYIRANQGHSIPVPGLELRPIESAELFPTVVHGTYRRHLDAILSSGGLSPMGRMHVHFARGLPDESGVISGMRHSCDVLIYLDLAAAMRDGVPFFVSANEVILSPGAGEPPLVASRYFSRIVDARTGDEISLDR